MAHWYDKDGNCAYEIVGKNGNLRATTLTDARKNGYVPSVTTILSCESSEALTTYKINQVLDAALVIPCVGDEKVWRQKVLNKSKEHAQSAASVGTEIHDALEVYYRTGVISVRYETYIDAVSELIAAKFPGVKWVPEQSFAHKEGFGGKVDMHSKEGIVLDFKTKDKDDIKQMNAYDGHHMQTAAYAVGLNIPKAKRYNLFISTKKPGLLKLTESVDFDREWGMFKNLLQFWQLKNKYKPDWE